MDETAPDAVENADTSGGEADGPARGTGGGAHAADHTAGHTTEDAAHSSSEAPAGGASDDDVSRGLDRTADTGAAGPLWLSRTVKLTLTVALTWFIFRQLGVSVGDLRVLSPERWHPSLPGLAASSALLATGYFVSAALWGRMVLELGGPRVSAGTACGVFFTANLGRYVPGKIWQIAGLTYLARRAGIPAGVAVVSAVVGQGIGLAGATLVGAGALFAANERMQTVGTAAVVGGGAIVLAASIPAIVRGGVRLLMRIAQRDLKAAPDVGSSFVLRWIVLYSCNWVVYAGAFWVLARSFGLRGSFVEVGPAFAAAYVLGYVAVFAPAGIGIREGFLVGFLEPIMGPSALALAVTARIWTTVVELVPAGYFATRQLRGREGGVGPEASPRRAVPSSASGGARREPPPSGGQRGE